MDADKITDFFKFHCEKMILMVVIGATGFMLYSGFKLEHYTDKQQPERLSADATEVRNAIDEDHNENIIPERVPTFDIVAATKRRDTPVDHGTYRLRHYWGDQDDKSIVRRSDPQLAPPTQLLAQGVMRVIAVRSNTEDYAIAALDPADQLEKVEKPKKRERRGRRGRGGGGGGYGEGGYGGEGDEEEMMEMMDMEEEYMNEMGGDTGTMAGGNRRFNAKNDFGVRPMATQDKRFPKPQVASFIAGTALLPHQETYENFRQALGEADGDVYDPRRDTPFYYNFEVQRADVTDKPVDQLQDADWTVVWNREKYTLLGAKIWSGFAPEIVPPDYRDDLITIWIPPVLLDDYRDFCLHPEIPMRSQRELEMESLGEEEVLDEVDPDTVFGGGNETLVAPGMRSRGGGMMDDAYGGEMDDYAGDMGMGFTMGYGPTGLEENPVQYKLLRFYDFLGLPNSPQPNRKYVYRLRYAVNDPNFPANPEMQPKVNSLSPEASVRVAKLMAEARANNARSYQRWSEWSTPCDPVSLPKNGDFYAGPVTPSSQGKWKIGGKDVTYQRDPPTAKILASQYSVPYATRIPMRMDVTEGSVLSHKEEFADVVDAITLDVKKLPDAEIVSGTTVVDLDGGDELEITEGLTETELTEPGFMLLFDSAGNLRLTDDIDGQEYYRIYSYADERGE